MSRTTYSDRGFARKGQHHGSYGDSARAFESSAASAPHVWLDVTSHDGSEAAVHLPLDAARALAADLVDLCDNHYQEVPR